jgi:hypothetical protein
MEEERGFVHYLIDFICWVEIAVIYIFESIKAVFGMFETKDEREEVTFEEIIRRMKEEGLIK